jgi:hypothetical protein
MKTFELKTTIIPHLKYFTFVAEKKTGNGAK